MAGSTGEVVAISAFRQLAWTFASEVYMDIPDSLCLLMYSPDGAGASQNSAQVHADDEPRVAACDFRRCRPPGSLHWKEKAAAWTVWFNKWVHKLRVYYLFKNDIRNTE